jgi:hypothetical protein
MRMIVLTRRQYRSPAGGTFRTAFEAAATPEARRHALAKVGLTIHVEEAEAALKGERELTDEDLAKVAGGDAGVIRYPRPLCPSSWRARSPSQWPCCLRRQAESRPRWMPSRL